MTVFSLTFYFRCEMNFDLSQYALLLSYYHSCVKSPKAPEEAPNMHSLTSTYSSLVPFRVCSIRSFTKS